MLHHAKGDIARHVVVVVLLEGGPSTSVMVEMSLLLYPLFHHHFQYLLVMNVTMLGKLAGLLLTIGTMATLLSD